MKPIRCTAVIALGLLAGTAQAESLRCNGRTASEGDTRLSVAYKCGQPVARDAYCAPVHYARTLNRVPDEFALPIVGCHDIEEWLYDRGPGNLMATVRFRGGVVQSIRYGAPR